MQEDTGQRLTRMLLEAKQNNDAVELARLTLLKRQRALVSEHLKLKERREELSGALADVEKRLNSVQQRAAALAEILELDFPPPAPPPRDLSSVPLLDAVAGVLEDSGCFLNDAQILERLQRHHVHFASLESFSARLHRLAEETPDGPLIKISPTLWARSDWAEQARISFPEVRRL